MPIPILAPAVAVVTSLFNSFAPKLLFGGAFFTAVYYGVDEMTTYAFSNGLPILPHTIRYLVTNSGLIPALNIYLKIISFGFITKQVLSYGRTTN